MPHQKPSKEELKAVEDEAANISEADLKEVPKDEEPQEPETETPKEVPEEPKDEVKEATPSEEDKERLKTKLSASARENQKIYAKNRVITNALVEADEIPEPTEEELQQTYRDWDVMSEVEKELAKETVVSKRWRQTISKAKEQGAKIVKWNESVDEFVEDPKTLNAHPELEGKAEEFQEFAKSEENNSVPFKTLVGAFLYERSKNGKPNKGRMFETGSGGPNDKPTPKTDTLTLEEGRKLRDADYTKWKEYLIAGKIQSDF